MSIYIYIWLRPINCLLSPRTEKEFRGEASWTAAWPDWKISNFGLLVCDASGPNKKRSRPQRRLEGRMKDDRRGTHGRATRQRSPNGTGGAQHSFLSKCCR